MEGNAYNSKIEKGRERECVGSDCTCENEIEREEEGKREGREGETE